VTPAAHQARRVEDALLYALPPEVPPLRAARLAGAVAEWVRANGDVLCPHRVAALAAALEPLDITTKETAP